MGAIEQARNRKEQASQAERDLRAEAKEQGLSEIDIEARLRAIRHAAEADCAAYMSTVDATKKNKHAKLVARLAKIKAKEAESLQKVNKDANTGNESPEDLEARVRAIQEQAQADVDAVLLENGKNSSKVHARLVKRLEALKQKQIKNEAMARMQASLNGASPQDTVKAVNKVREVSEMEEAQLVIEVMQEEAKEEIQTLEDVATLKANQGTQIYELLKSQQNATEDEKMTAQEKQDALEKIKRESDERIAFMLKSIGIEADSKHKKMLERITKARATQMANKEKLQAQRAKATDAESLERIDDAIQQNEINAENNIENLTKAIADRSKTKGNKSQKRLTKLLELAVAHDKSQIEMNEMEETRKKLEQQANDIQQTCDEEASMASAQLAIAKEQAQEKLNKRLQGKRKKRQKALQHNARAKKQMVNESKAMDQFQDKKKKLANLEDEIAKISEEFHSHAEAQSKAMDEEKARQHKSVAARRAQARKKRRNGSVKGGQKSTNETGSNGNGAWRIMKKELTESLGKAEMRKNHGKTAEEQLAALLADLKLNLAHQENVGNTMLSVIQKPRLNLGPPPSSNKDALAQARDHLKEKMNGKNIERSDALAIMAKRGTQKQNLPALDLL